MIEEDADWPWQFVIFAVEACENNEGYKVHCLYAEGATYWGCVWYRRNDEQFELGATALTKHTCNGRTFANDIFAVVAII